jgi:hypothetical protein
MSCFNSKKNICGLKRQLVWVSEFMLRFMAWLCVYDDKCKGSQTVIVTGPNQELAVKLIKRMKGFFKDTLDVTFDSK